MPSGPACTDDLVAAVEQHQRVIAGVVHRRRVGLRDLLGQHRARIRGVAERARAREHVGEGVARGLDLEPLPLARRQPRHRDSSDRRPRLPPALVLPQNSPQMMRTRVPSSSVTSGIALDGMSW